MDQTRYRADIDGLRAFAVLAVLFYHLDVKFFSGGYVGVDVFLVISGFLITRLIRDEVLQTGKFNFINFYLRRARRLLPSFFFSLSIFFLAAVLLFPPPQMQDFSKSFLYSMAAMANFHFWSQSGYFDVASVYKPLLHIWSLSVEEQFYFIWPLLVVFLLLKTPRRAVPFILLVVGGVSFYLNFAFADGDAAYIGEIFTAYAERFEEGMATIFYLMPFRVFEFCFGALLVWLVEQQPKNKLTFEPLVLVGFALVVYPALTYTEETLFPFYNALAPCLGAALLIYAGEAKYGGLVLRGPILVEIGKISYSLYLIHWPAIVFYKYYRYDFGALTFVEQVGIGAVSIIAARFIYVYIEQPFRRRSGETKKVSTPVFLFLHGIAAVTLFSLAFLAWQNDGWAWRMPNAITARQIEERKGDHAEWQDRCRISRLDSQYCNPDASLQVLVVGDSHYYVGYNMLAVNYYGQDDVNLISSSTIINCDFAAQGGSLIVTGSGPQTKSKCQDLADLLNSPYFIEKLDVVVLSFNKVFSQKAALPVLEYLTLKRPDLKIIIIGPYIDLGSYECVDVVNRFGDSSFCKDERFVDYFGDHIEDEPFYLSYMSYDPLYVDVVAMLCPQGALDNCATSANGDLMFYDNNHMSLEFSLMMGRVMYEWYGVELGRMGFPALGHVPMP